MIALATSIMTVALVHHYGNSRPTVIQVDQGRTHPVKIHSRTVYLTGGEMAAVLGTHAIAILSIGVFLGVLLKSTRSQRSGPAKSA